MVVSSVGLCLSLVMIKCRAGTRVTPTVSLGRRSRLSDPDTETEHCILRPDISNITPQVHDP